jgi:hypothetical protein
MLSRTACFAVRLAAFVAAPLAAHAALTWETTRVETTLALNQEQFVTRFHFKNTGTTPVTITEVRPSCGCTTAELPKKIYAPGESGYVHTVFTVGDRVGLQQKVVMVTTADAAEQPTPLVLRLTVPVAVALDQRLLMWTAAEGGAEKAVSVELNPDAGVKITGVRSNLPAVAARLVTDEPGKRFRVLVKPAANLAATRATVLIDTEAGGQPKVYSIYAVVN